MTTDGYFLLNTEIKVNLECEVYDIRKKVNAVEAARRLNIRESVTQKYVAVFVSKPMAEVQNLRLSGWYVLNRKTKRFVK